MATLNSKLSKFRQETADATTRNLAHSRPASSTIARVRTPQPTTAAASSSVSDATKRSHDAAFPQTQPPNAAASAGTELLSNVSYARNYLKSRSPQVLPFDEIIRHLSLPNDAQKNIPYIRQALEKDDRVEFIPKGSQGMAKDGFKYRPKHPVTNAEELRDYLARQDTARGIAVAELKDGWPECVKAIDTLEDQGAVLVARQKKDNAPKMVWIDNPASHIQISSDFRDFWLKTKLPASESEIRNELEKAGITPTSQVKEVKKIDTRKKERKRPVRRGGKITNSHMAGILKDFSRR